MFNIQTIVLTDATDGVVGIVLRQTGCFIIRRSVAVAAAPVGVAPSKSCCNIFAVREANTHGALVPLTGVDLCTSQTARAAAALHFRLMSWQREANHWR
jgi:hypothetical protein